ncbi:MAG: formylmethanofuran dehydrogenase subunit E family protein [Pirellulales bacterium]|nr:formylmethanofuran dehydrogenase subunit E family protein [Pirellulales bacterium]
MKLHLCIAWCLVLFVVHGGLAGEPTPGLPVPHYHPDPADPDWLAKAVQFHGHLGPWATAGIRAGMAGREAVGAFGYFDVDVTVEGPMVKPPHSCFLDGLQVSTGATLGKRNLKWIKAKDVVVRLKNTRTGRTAEVRPTNELMDLLNPIAEGSKDKKEKEPPAEASQKHDHHHDHRIEAVARKIAAMPEKKLFSVTVR